MRAGARRTGFTLMELLVVMSIMIAITTILVSSYFGMTRAASYRAAESGVLNLLQLARQRACMDGTKVFFMLIDSNTCVLVHGVGELRDDMDSRDYEGRHRFYDAYADLHTVANEFSKLRAWNMDQDTYGDDVTITLDRELARIPGETREYFRQVYRFDMRLPRAADYKKWKAGDRYGFELYPRQMLPRGFFYGVNGLNNFPKNFKLVFNADGSSAWYDPQGNLKDTGTVQLYIYEKIAKESQRASVIEIKSPNATIKVKKP